MAIKEILTFPNTLLREPTEKVTVFDAELKALARDMEETMFAAPGVGLAANQIGILKRLIVVDDYDEENKKHRLLDLANPEILHLEGEQIQEEGCLSVPEFRAEVKRATAVVVRAQDLNGDEVMIRAESFLAIILQHEIDHLNGVLFIDHLSPLKRAAVKRRLRHAGQSAETNG